jgi:replicative DNA helicase
MSYNHEAEAAVCGVLMLRPEQVDECQDILAPSDFTQPHYRTIYETILALYEAGQEIDPLTVADKTGDMTIAAAVLSNAPGGQAKSYAQIVRDKARLRELASAWGEANQIITDATLELSDRVERATDVLAGVIKTEEVSSKTLTGRDLFYSWYEELNRLSQLGDSITGIKTGFPELDKSCKGFHGGEMIVIAARPGMGKTNLAINLAWTAIKQNKSVLYISLEMSSNELMHRIASQAMSIDYEGVQTAQLGESDVGHKITSFATEYMNVPLHINDKAMQTMASIRREAKKIKRKSGLDMIVIDHIGLVTAKSDSMYQRMTDISREIKLLAKDLDVPVIALTQLNRAIEQRHGARPKLSDLRDSGAIEQDADAVIFPFRDNDPDADYDSRLYGQLIIGKMRHGTTGIVPALVQFNYCRFVPVLGELPPNWNLTSAEKQELLGKERSKRTRGEL